MVSTMSSQPTFAPKASFSLRGWLTDRLTHYLSEPVRHYDLRGRNDFDHLKSTTCKGDVLLVEGDQRVSAVIKYLTQSSWSHAVLYIGDELLCRDAELKERTIEQFGDDADNLIVEALFDGVIVSPLVKYVDFNVRLCRPHCLRSEHLKVILDDCVASIGWHYDLRNILDLAVHFIFLSILPGRHRNEVLRFGSGASSQVMCTSLLGQLFHKVGFPVLPTVTYPDEEPAESDQSKRSLWSYFQRRRRFRYAGVYRRRHPTLLTPRDFDISPYFEIIKFNVIPERRFDYSRIEWAPDLDSKSVTDEVA
jgi:hypothetical protein